jgi:hypothetical protein
MELSNLLKRIQRHYAIILGNDDATIQYLAKRISKIIKKRNIKIDIHKVLIPTKKSLEDGYNAPFSLGPLKYTINELPIIIIDNQLFSLGILPTEDDFLRFFEEGISPTESNPIKNKMEKDLTLEQVLSLVKVERGFINPTESPSLPQEKIDELIQALKRNSPNKITNKEQGELNKESEIKIVTKRNVNNLMVAKQLETEKISEESSCITCSQYLSRTQICSKFLKRVKHHDDSFYNCEYHKNKR